MRISYLGSRNTRRVVRQYVWSAENKHVCEVGEALLCAELLTSPGPEFAVAQDEPILQTGMSESQIAGLALFGIAALEGLAALNRSGIAALAGATGERVTHVNAWVKQAKNLLSTNGGTND